MALKKSLVPVERIEQAIMLLRGHTVILDADLATLHGMETRRLNEQVRRNAARFAKDFMFQLTMEEFDNLKAKFATSSCAGGASGHSPSPSTAH